LWAGGSNSLRDIEAIRGRPGCPAFEAFSDKPGARADLQSLRADLAARGEVNLQQAIAGDVTVGTEYRRHRASTSPQLAGFFFQVPLPC
jgi:hypothetical protein